MSNDSSSELPNSNPYAPPSSQFDSGSSGNPLFLPGIFLLILSSLFVLLIFASLPRQIIRIRAIDMSTPEGAGYLLGSIGSLALWLLMNLVIAWGAISMIRLKSYGSAYTAAIFSVIPVCSPCFLLGIPFGIWTIIVLNRPEVKQRFVKREIEYE